MSGPPRVVLDTNVVLDLLHFHDPGVAAIDAAIRSGRVQVITDASCLEELRRVLVYPEFGRDARARAALLEDFLRFVVMFEVTAGAPVAAALPVPRCSDADDQKFIALALHCDAAFLISKDRAVLRMARRIRRISTCVIIAPPGFRLPG